MVCLVLLVLAMIPLPSGASPHEDGGAAVYGESLSLRSETPEDARIVKDFPVAQKARIVVQPGGVRGLGLLAEYPEGGPGRLFVGRHTRIASGEPYRPITLVRVFDPRGNLVVVEEWTDQEEEIRTRILPIPAGPGGIWRVSFSGGRQGDEVEVRLPATPVWGVRGEMALGVTSTTPRPAWLWIPSRAQKVLVGVESGSPTGIRIFSADGNTLLAQTESDPTGRPGRLVLDAADAGGLCRLEVPELFAGALVFDGLPGLLCPTREAAERLRGGTHESHGFCVAGPLQARARNWMVEKLPEVEPTVALAFPAEIPADLESPQIHMLAFGKYGPLSNLDGMIEAQNGNLQADNPFLGSFQEVRPEDRLTNWSHFLPGRWAPFFDSASLAAAAAFDSPVNPAFGNRQIVTRSTLAAFHHLASMQGDDLLRENTLFDTRYPITLAFFVFPGGVSQSFHALQNQLEPEAAAIWKEGMMAVGDKLADYQGYQSNQWAHMMRGHLDVFLATGEKRFLGYFERMAAAFLDNTFGPESKYGQHPAGYFLEEYGPDGNYDRLNVFAVVSAYHDYRRLKEARPEMVDKLHAAIGRNLRFRSFFWLPQPDGTLHAPTAINSRTLGPLSGAGYPGDLMARADFPLAAARHALTPEPPDTGAAWTMAHVANTDAWARRVIEKGLREKSQAFPFGGKEGSGWWLPHLETAARQPRRVEPGRLPVKESRGEWELPGLVAWKRGEIYGVVFYDVAGSDRVPRAILGGGPTALWTRGAGSFLASMHAVRPGAEPPRSEMALTYACVFGRDAAGNVVASGREHPKREDLEGGYAFLSEFPPNQTLCWEYLPGDEGLEMRVRHSGTDGEFFLNLPLGSGQPGTQVKMRSPQVVDFSTEKGGVEISWSGDAAGQLEPSDRKEITRLVIPLARDGSPLVLHFRPRAP